MFLFIDSPSVLPAHRHRNTDGSNIDFATSQQLEETQDSRVLGGRSDFCVSLQGQTQTKRDADTEALIESLENTIVRIPDVEIFEDMDGVVQTLAVEIRRLGRVGFGSM